MENDFYQKTLKLYEIFESIDPNITTPDDLLEKVNTYFNQEEKESTNDDNEYSPVSPLSSFCTLSNDEDFGELSPPSNSESKKSIKIEDYKEQKFDSSKNTDNLQDIINKNILSSTGSTPSLYISNINIINNSSSLPASSFSTLSQSQLSNKLSTILFDVNLPGCQPIILPSDTLKDENFSSDSNNEEVELNEESKIEIFDISRSSDTNSDDLSDGDNIEIENINNDEIVFGKNEKSDLDPVDIEAGKLIKIEGKKGTTEDINFKESIQSSEKNKYVQTSVNKEDDNFPDLNQVLFLLEFSKESSDPYTQKLREYLRKCSFLYFLG